MCLLVHPEYFREVHGPTFPLAQNAPLFSPSDQVEVQRLDFLYASLKHIMNGIYHGPAKDVLSETADRRKRVLDLITAEGNW